MGKYFYRLNFFTVPAQLSLSEKQAGIGFHDIFILR